MHLAGGCFSSAPVAKDRLDIGMCSAPMKSLYGVLFPVLR